MGEGSRFTRREVIRGGGAAALGGMAALAGISCGGGSSGGGGPMTLQMWVWETVDHWKAVVAKSGFSQKFPNVRLQFTALSSTNILDKFVSALSAGVASGLPDICRISADWYQQIVHTGGVVETTKTVKPHQADIVPAIYQMLDLNGKMYGIPDDMGAVAMAYRVDLFEKAGLPTDPDQVAALWPTYDDYLNVGRELAKIGVKLTNVDPPTGAGFGNLELQGSVGEFDKDGKVIFDDDFHVLCAETLRKLYSSGLVTSFSTAGTGSPQFWNAIKQGQFATMQWPNWEDFTVIDFAPETKSKWRVAYLPKVDSDSRRIATADGCLQVVPKAIADDRARTALQVSSFLRLTTQATRSHMASFPGAFVSYVPALDSMRSTPSPVLDGQSAYGWFLDAITKEGLYPHYRTSTHFAKAGELINDAIDATLTKGTPARQALQSAANQVRSLQKSSGSR